MKVKEHLTEEQSQLVGLTPSLPCSHLLRVEKASPFLKQKNRKRMEQLFIHLSRTTL